tara:strand:+ start:80 stop:235 length:156 start_codon:yes stop_codon:yes gene_type:complete
MTKLTIEGIKFCGSIVPEAFIVLIHIPAKWHGTLAELDPRLNLNKEAFMAE